MFGFSRGVMSLRRPLFPSYVSLRAVLTLCVVAVIVGCGTKANLSESTPPSSTPTPTPAADFTLSAAPASVNLTAGSGSQQVTLSAAADNGFSGAVSITIAGLPAGVTAAPSTLSLQPGTPQSITLSASANADVGSATVTVTGTSGTLQHSATFNLTVATAPLSADFSLTVNPGTLSIQAGASGQQVSVSAAAINGFSGTVSVSLTNLPAGVTASPATLDLTPGTPPQFITLSASAGAAIGAATVTLTGTSGALQHTSTLALTVTAAPPPPDFSLTVNPGTLSIQAGASGQQASVSATPVNGFSGTVSVSLANLPAGVAASPATLNLTPGVPQFIMLSASAGAAIGTATVTFTGTASGLQHTATLALTVAAAPPPPDFFLALSPNSLSLQAGAAQPTSVSVTALNGFSGTVSVASANLPAGVTASPATLNLTPGTPQSITLSASAGAAIGTTMVTFTGTSGPLQHTAPLALTVTAAPPPPDFFLVLRPNSLNLQAGAAGYPTSVSVTALNGFTGTVSVSLSNLPAGVTANPSTLALTPGTPQSITLSASAGAAIGTTTVTFTGTSGALQHTATLALTVTAPPPPPDFFLVLSPNSLSLQAGAAGHPTSLSVTALNGFSGIVSISLTNLPVGVTASPATLNLTPGTPQSITLSASAGAAIGTATVTFTGTSGALQHTTPLALTVTAPPDFSLALSPNSLSLQAGAAGEPTAVSATALNGFSGTISISLTNLPAGVTASPSTLSLTPGTPQSITFTANASAASASASVSVNGESGSLAHSATLALSVTVPSSNDMVTYHYDNARTGLNPNETILTPANVSSSTFGKLNMLSTDGLVDAEPLYLSSVTIDGTVHNVLYVVTEHDSIYAFDADSGSQLWKASALESGETTSDIHNCYQITPEIGITSTPVIDRHAGANGTIFVVAMSKDNKGAYHQRLHALDITTGLEVSGSPTEITATYPGTGDGTSNGTLIFAPGQYVERAGLLLMNQTIYLGWTSHCDQRPYTGWVMAYSETTLQQTQALDLTPNGSEGAIWMSGAGLAGDTAGNVYLLDANGTLDTTFDSNGFPSQGDFGNAIVKLSTSNNTLAVADYFEPYNSVAESNADVDLGSGGVLLLPDLADANGTIHHLLVGAGKDTNIYIGDRDNLGKFNSGDNNSLYQELTDALPDGVRSMPAYFNNTVYYGGISDSLRAFPISNAKLATTPSSKSVVGFAYPGSTPSISANGTKNGIVWALESGIGATAVLHAFDATNLANEFYNSNQAPSQRDNFGTGNKFITPMIINGKVYVGTPSGVAVFGLLP
jgi:hypothetical protein